RYCGRAVADASSAIARSTANDIATSQRRLVPNRSISGLHNGLNIQGKVRSLLNFPTSVGDTCIAVRNVFDAAWTAKYGMPCRTYSPGTNVHGRAGGRALDPSAPRAAEAEVGSGPVSGRSGCGSMRPMESSAF